MRKNILLAIGFAILFYSASAVTPPPTSYKFYDSTNCMVLWKGKTHNTLPIGTYSIIVDASSNKTLTITDANGIQYNLRFGVDTITPNYPSLGAMEGAMRVIMNSVSGGGGGGDASSANQVKQIDSLQRLSNIKDTLKYIDFKLAKLLDSIGKLTNRIPATSGGKMPVLATVSGTVATSEGTYSDTFLNAVATTVIKSGAGTLGPVTINVVGTAPTLVIKDGYKTLYNATIAAGMVTLWFNVATTTNITVTIGGIVSSGGVAVQYK